MKKKFLKLITFMLIAWLLLTAFPLLAFADVVCSPDNQGDSLSVFVAGNPDLYPVEYFDEKTKRYDGVLPRLYERISRETGINFTYIYSSSEDQQTYLVKNQQVDMVSAYVVGSEVGNYLSEDYTVLPFTYGGREYKVAIGFTQNCDAEKRDRIKEYLSNLTEDELTDLTVSFVMEHGRLKLTEYWLAVVIIAVAIILGTSILLICVIRKNKKKALQRYQFDEKTGLYSKKYFADFLEDRIPPELRELYVMAQISIDYGSLLKYYGKDNADKLETYIADRLREFCVENEIAAYFDDATFGVAYLCTTEQAAVERLNTLVESLNAENGILTQDYKVTMHAGAYRLHRQKDSAYRICNIANEAYKRAEDQELDSFFADHAFIKLVESRALLQRETVQAVKKGQILYYMQYVVDIKNNRIYGAEGLSRWEHPREGLLEPGAYIELMRQAKTIGYLDYYMFERSCQQLERWESEGLTDFCVSCNFDRLTIANIDFSDRIIEIANKYNFNRKHMILEITEETFVYNRGNACHNTKLLSEAGFSLALDDFGSGYASFRNLIEYHVTHLKLDRSMLPLFDTEDGVTLLRGIITAAHSLGVIVLMEGVETFEQLERVRAMDIDLVQGFMFSRVVPQIELGRVRKRLEQRLASGILPEGMMTFADVNPDAPEDNVYEDDEDRESIRYRWSFTARLHRASDELASYYTQLKNQLLSYKKVRSRISWSYDTIAYRRNPIVKFAMRQKSLLVYLALDPAQFEDTKYFFTDASEKKKYEQVPMRLKIRGSRGFKHASELISILAERLELQELKVFEEQDYSLPMRSVESLIADGLIKVNERAMLALASETLQTEPEQSNITNEENTMENDIIMQENEEYVFSRYRWSFTARLHQAPEAIAQYYSEIKNAFLAYKKVKSRISWNCDTINFGRERLAKFVLTSKTLYVYLALNPADFEESKYFFRDASDIKKYEKVPMRIKVRSPRGVKHVLELIEYMAVLYDLTPSKKYEEQSFVLPYESFEELFNRQLIKLIETKSDADGEDGGDEVEYSASEVPNEPVIVETVVEEPVVEEPVVEEPKAAEEPIVEEPPKASKTVAVIEETPAEELQNAELIDAETIHVAFLERICRQFDADEFNAHVKVVYKKKREKKTSVFDINMRRNR